MKNVTCAHMVCCAVMAAVAASSLFAQTPSPGMAKELVATWERAAGDTIDVAEAMPEERYDFKPTPEMRTFSDQLVHVAGVVQRFIDTAKGAKGESDHPHQTMTKAEVVGLLKQTFQAGQGMIASLTDAQLVEQVKFPFGDRMVTRYGFWMGPLYPVADHYGQLVVYLRLNGIVPPATARRSR
jgi:DinB superfamily